MFRALCLYIWIFFFFLSVEPRYRKIKRFERENKIAEKDELLLKTIRELYAGVIKRAGIELLIEGKENIPDDGCSFVATPNHSSFLDIPIMLAVFDREMGFVSKKENAKVPFVGRWITVIYSVYIDRTSARNAIKSLSDGAEIIKSGYPQVIFPDGTRSTDGKVHEFRAGSYKLAQKAKAAVLPVAISGTFESMPKGKFIVRPATVKVKIFPPMDSVEMSTGEMAEKCQNMISEYVESNLA